MKGAKHKFTFDLFAEAVFNGHFHPKAEVCVTGGEDDKAYIWNWKTGEILMETPAFKDSVVFSVVFSKFNKDGTLLALADMAGDIKVHRITEGQASKEVVWEFETSDITVRNSVLVKAIESCSKRL